MIQESPFFPPSKIISKNNITIGVIGIAAQPTDPSFEYGYRPPHEALFAGFKSLGTEKDRLDLIVILSLPCR